MPQELRVAGSILSAAHWITHPKLPPNSRSPSPTPRSIASQCAQVTTEAGKQKTSQKNKKPIKIHSQRCWQVVGLPFGPANLVLGLPKSSALTPLLNGAILQLRGNGVIDQLKRRWVDDLDQCTSAASQVPELGLPMCYE